MIALDFHPARNGLECMFAHSRTVQDEYPKRSVIESATIGRLDLLGAVSNVFFLPQRSQSRRKGHKE